MDQLSRYKKQAKLGEGTYGEVFRVQDTENNEILAMKKIQVENDEEGIPGTAIREISLLRELNHENVVKIRRVICQNRKVYIMFEHCEMDLRKFMNANDLSQKLVRELTKQVMAGTNYCHIHRVMHRDLKPQNVLLNISGGQPICKLADFGLARSFGVPIRHYTHEIVTLWYRSPEVLLGSKLYSTAVDVWSIGCIMAELSTGEPLFQGRSEVEMLFEIFQLRGTPTEDTWPGVSQLKDWRDTFPKLMGQSLQKRLRNSLSAQGFDLLEKLLEMDPGKRIPLSEAMSHKWFLE
ncbi:Kinase [Hexamita inflata]|uniref:cyclin-dependent kinase n=1 Tax=Hexamita inflata TaxID=28002 RepID=A0AA86NET8_9EUKA|nr:CMGC CDK [Hexamita inflata]